jgi:1-deoxy-D-xylulose-5-phosphate reductoisomerase
MGSPVKKIAILGSTGSIGQQTLDIIRNFPQHFEIIGLTAGHNVALLRRQIDEFKPNFYCHDAKDTKPDIAGSERISAEELASHPTVDLVVIASSGKAGLAPTLAAVKAGKTVALANKESLVAAGEIITAEAKKHGASILPIDSEHSAIWQCLRGEVQPLSRIILTASGGPFRHFSRTEMEAVTPQQALNHPSWKMGRKVTIDSATLMNKGLEIIEARWLFDTTFDKIQVVVHPQSIIHSMVEFADGSTKAQLSPPDMRLPIQYALSYPKRWSNDNLPKIDWSKTKELTFEAPDMESFPCLKLAVEAGKRGGTYPAVLCATDETAVELFLTGQIKFTDIARLVEQLLFEHQSHFRPSLDEIAAADAWAREKTMELAAGAYRC